MAHSDDKSELYRAGRTTSFGPTPHSGTHWPLELSNVMTLEEYKAPLHPLNAKAVPYRQFEYATTGPEELELPNQSDHPSKAVCFVFDVLSTVAREKTPITGWEDNDYTYLAMLAKSLHVRETNLSAFVYQPHLPLVKEQTLIAAATLAYIKTMDEKCKSAGDKDEEADWANDRALLHTALSLDNLKVHPFLAEATREL